MPKGVFFFKKKGRLIKKIQKTGFQKLKGGFYFLKEQFLLTQSSLFNHILTVYLEREVIFLLIKC